VWSCQLAVIAISAIGLMPEDVDPHSCETLASGSPPPSQWGGGAALATPPTDREAADRFLTGVRARVRQWMAARP
jgi:hypothetical protein